MVSSFFEDVDDATQEEIEKDHVALCLADEQNVGVLRMSIHCSDSADWQTDVSA